MGLLYDGCFYRWPIQVIETDLIEEVTIGYPAAQFYGIGDKWIEFNLSYIAGREYHAMGKMVTT